MASPFIDVTPLAFTAAMKSERILVKRLAVMPAATGLISASRVLISGRSSRRAAGSWPSSTATRFTAERRSRTRVGPRSELSSRAVSTAARVAGAALTPFVRGDLVFEGLDMASLKRAFDTFNFSSVMGTANVQSEAAPDFSGLLQIAPFNRWPPPRVHLRPIFS